MEVVAVALPRVAPNEQTQFLATYYALQLLLCKFLELERSRFHACWAKTELMRLRCHVRGRLDRAVSAT